MIVTLIALLIFILGGSYGAFYLLSHNASSSTSVLPAVGQAFFVSSGQLKEGSSQGINDEFQVDLHNIPTPAPGKGYYAWLLSDKGQIQEYPFCLANFLLTMEMYIPSIQGINNMITFSQPQVASLSQKRNANTAPRNPLQDQSAWRYYAELPQIPNSRNT